MVYRWVIMFGVICLAFAVLTVINFWQIDHVEGKTMFGLHFGSVWSFWSIYGLVVFPAVVFANVLFWAIYYYGYHFWFKKLWIMQITTYAGGLIMMAIITWLWYGELPNKGTLVGIGLCAAGMLTSILWK